MAKLDKARFDDRQLIELIYDRVEDLESKISNNYATKIDLSNMNSKFDNELDVLKEKLSPVFKIVYGLVALVLTSVVGGLIALVVTK